MRVSVPVCEAKAMLMGAGAFTGRYKTTQKKYHLHAEMWDGEHFRWCRLTKADMEEAEFRNRLGGELSLTGHHGLWFEAGQLRIKALTAAWRMKCFVGLHDYETVADGYSCRVEKCRHCPKLYAYKMRYWFGHEPDSEKHIFRTGSKREIHTNALQHLRTWHIKAVLVQEVFAGDFARPGIATRFSLVNDKLRSEKVCTVFM